MAKQTFRDFESFGSHYLKEVANWNSKRVEMSLSDRGRSPLIECTLRYDRARPQGKETSLGYQFKIERNSKIKGKKYSIQHYAKTLGAEGMLKIPLSQGVRLLGLQLAA